MSLEAIVARIEAEAEAEAEAVLAAARREEAEALAAATAELDDEEAREEERRTQRLAELRQRLELHARRSADRRVEHARRKLIDRALAEAVKRLAELPDDEYRKLVAGILAASRLSGEVEVVISRRDESRVTSEFLRKLSTGERSFVLSSRRHEEPGGVLLVAGAIAENATFSMLARLVHEGLAMELAGLLSGE